MSESMREIANRIAAQHKVTLAELRTPNEVPGARVRRIAWPRQHAMVEMLRTGRFSTTKIGQFFGDRDHTTVIHARRAYEGRA